jgi:hypothetical protein
MLTPEERALLTDVQDHLLELYVLKEQASNKNDWNRVQSLQADIAEAEAQRTEIRQLDTIGSA